MYLLKRAIQLTEHRRQWKQNEPTLRLFTVYQLHICAEMRQQQRVGGKPFAFVYLPINNVTSV
jgi:hypothetical protein